MNYYYADNAHQLVGPMPLEKLHGLAREGTIASETYVLQEGGQEWQRYETLAGGALVPSGGAKPPSLPVAAPAAYGTMLETTDVPHPAPAPGSTKECPFCAERILVNAKKCKHCGEIVDVTLRAAQEAQRHHQPTHVYMNAGGAVVGGEFHKRTFPHWVHAIFTFFTFGMWIPIWIICYLLRDRAYYW